MTEPDLNSAVAGLNAILAGGRIDLMFAPDGPRRMVGIAHELQSDGTDREVVVVHAADYELVQMAMHAKLVHAGYGAAVTVP